MNKKDYRRSLENDSIIGLMKGEQATSPPRGTEFRPEQMLLFDLWTTRLNVYSEAEFAEEVKLEIAIRSPRYDIQSCLLVNIGVKLVFLECRSSDCLLVFG